MNTTRRTVAVPLAFAAGSGVALTVLPHTATARVVPDAAAFADRIADAAVSTTSHVLSWASSWTPALLLVIAGFAVTLLVAAFLSRDWQARADENEGFDIR